MPPQPITLPAMPARMKQMPNSIIVSLIPSKVMVSPMLAKKTGVKIM